MTHMLHFDPAYATALAPTDDVTLRGDVPPIASSRSLVVKVDTVTRLTWDGTTVTLSPGWLGAVVCVDGALAATLRPAANWLPGTTYALSATYQDALTSPALTAAVGIAAVVFSYELAPAEGAAVAPRRPLVQVRATPSSGAAVDVEVDVDGRPAVAGGAATVPEFTGRTWVAGSHGFAQATWRRAFDPGARVTAVARPGVLVGSTIYRAARRWTFVVAARVARVDALPDFPVSDHPTRDYLRESAAACLRTTAGAPNAATLCALVARRSVVGQLVRFAPGFAYDPAPEDVPGEAALVAWVARVRPVWRAALNELAPPEWRDALDAAWASGHVVEQAAAVATLLLGRDVHGL